MMENISFERATFLSCRDACRRNAIKGSRHSALFERFLENYMQ